MIDYDSDSDSSGTADVETNVVLGYASQEPTGEPFSQLGGHPTWLDDKTAPSGALARCKECNGFMSLLLQIRGDIPQFPTHERRLYILACRKKTCRRRDGSLRGFRAIRQNVAQPTTDLNGAVDGESAPATKQPANLGERLFGVAPVSNSQASPFAPALSGQTTLNPFSVGGFHNNPFASASSPNTELRQKSESDTLPETFAQKVGISAPDPSSRPIVLQEQWPDSSAFPNAYPRYYLEPDKEYIDLEPTRPPAGVRIDRDLGEAAEGTSSSAEDRIAFESSMDKTFQRFADRLAQNPEQVLRYEYAGQPLLYSRADRVGKLLAPTQEGADIHITTAGSWGKSRMPRCTNCGAGRVFELQLTPHAITELEADEISLEGLEWGTVILGVCSEDCQEKDKKEGQVGYVEEWVGVQWEEAGC